MSDRLTEINSESGCFEIDEDGQLVRFSASFGNEINPNHWYPIHCKRAIRHLHIPEGVRFIGNAFASVRREYEDFSELFVLEDVLLPRSLICIKPNAFHWCCIHDMTIPPSLSRLGAGSFMHCLIYRLDIQKEILQYAQDMDAIGECPENELIFDLRCFKESLIREVHADSLGYLRTQFPSPKLQALTRNELIDHLMRDARVLRVAEPAKTTTASVDAAV